MDDLKIKIYNKKDKKTYDVIGIDFRRRMVTFYKSERIDHPDGSVELNQGDFEESFDDVEVLS